ncbi:hypothetical protein AXZ77_2941 [Thioclava sp. ES.031]|uniref:hypothetical protein n=1 Tax=Thioclava sp. ES.031 TaxID=1798203 RepID=UPI000BF5E257|nr:hypothetical protein [Thioclava sp. ES.031]PFG64306.1 hypothetical protein AXZ77_2941 [Thioclava sp. ES.031]
MIPEVAIEHGRKLFQSATNLRKSAPQLDSLLDSLWEKAQDEKYFGDVVDLGEGSGGGAKAWIAPAYSYNAGIAPSPHKKNKGKKQANKAPFGTISFIVRLCNAIDANEDLPDWPWLTQACLIIGWHPNKEHDDKWNIENFEAVDENQVAIRFAGEGLWAWRDEGGDEDYAYFYVLPLFALTDDEKAEECALQPLKALFEAADPVSVAKEAFGNAPVLLPTSQ